MERPAAEYDTETQPYHQTDSGISITPSLQLLRAVAELLETEPDAVLAEMGYAPDEESRTPYRDVMAAR